MSDFSQIVLENVVFFAMGSLLPKVIAITGGASGIGLASAWQQQNCSHREEHASQLRIRCGKIRQPPSRHNANGGECLLNTPVLLHT